MRCPTESWKLHYFHLQLPVLAVSPSSSEVTCRIWRRGCPAVVCPGSAAVCPRGESGICFSRRGISVHLASGGGQLNLRNKLRVWPGGIRFGSPDMWVWRETLGSQWLFAQPVVFHSEEARLAFSTAKLRFLLFLSKSCLYQTAASVLTRVCHSCGGICNF